jgi:Ankyrin repeats (3 copies)
MKNIITLIALIGLSATSFSQKKLSKIIEKDDVAKLEKYIEKNDGQLDQLILIASEDGLEESFSPLMIALLDSSQSIIQYFLNHLDLFENKSHVISEVFIHSLSEKENPLSQQLFDLGANPNDSCGACWNNNALMVAAVYGNEEWFFKLKDSADFAYTNINGRNLAHIAASSPSSRIGRWVFSNKNVDINLKDDNGETPLDAAVWNEENPKMVTYLLKEGAMISEAKNLLQAWPFNPSEEIFYDNLIFNRRADVWKEDEDGSIPLLWTLVPEEAGDYKIQQLGLFKRILDMMMGPEQAAELKKFQNENIFIFNSMKDFLSICELRGDYSYSVKIYADFVKLCAISEVNSEFRVLTKKNYKKAVELFGEEAVQEIYSDNELWYP